MTDTKRIRRHDRSYHEGQLHALLVAKLPTFVRNGRIDLNQIAKAGSYSRFGVCLWMLEDKVSPRAVRLLTELSAEARVQDPTLPELTREDLWPFLLAA